MKSCFNCGQILSDEANICFKCGTVQKQERKAKKEIVDGEIHICPDCGKPIKSLYTTVCECGYELRGIDGSQKISAFLEELRRKPTVDSKVQFIRNFIVPNTKEDIFEFASQASRNIKNYDRNGDDTFDQDEISLVNAWRLLLEQCRNRATKLFKDTSSDYREIIDMYDEAEKLYIIARSTQKKKENRQRAHIGLKFFSKKAIITIAACSLAIIITLGLLIGVSVKKSHIDKSISNAELLVEKGDYVQAINSLIELESSYLFLSKKVQKKINNNVYDAENKYLESLVLLCTGAINQCNYDEAREILKSFNSISGKLYDDYLTEKTRLTEEILYHETGIKTIVMTVASSELIGKKCSVVKGILIDTFGFKAENIVVYSYGQNESEIDVYSITINDKSSFNVGTKFTDDVMVYIECERKIIIGKSSKEINKDDCNTIVTYLETLGFVNIKLESSTNFWYGEGKIISITINGKEKFEADEIFLSTAEIVIVYKRYK